MILYLHGILRFDLQFPWMSRLFEFYPHLSLYKMKFNKAYLFWEFLQRKLINNYGQCQDFIMDLKFINDLNMKKG